MSAFHYLRSFEEEKAMQFSKNIYHIAHLECKTKCEIGKGPKFTHLLVDYQIMWKLSEIFRKNLSKEAKIAYFLTYNERKKWGMSTRGSAVNFTGHEREWERMIKQTRASANSRSYERQYPLETSRTIRKVWNESLKRIFKNLMVLRRYLETK